MPLIDGNKSREGEKKVSDVSRDEEVGESSE